MSEILVKKIKELTSQEKNRIISRAKVDFDKLEDKIKFILNKVKQEKDKAVYELTEKFDKCKLNSLRVSKQEIDEVIENTDSEIIETFKHIKRNLINFYEKEKPNEWYTYVDKGIKSGMIYRPFERIGVYVPAGKAMYPTIVLRICVPAKVAGVKDIVLCTPPDKDGNVSPGVVITAFILGIKEIYKIGGAQAIGAMGYGTESIKPVQKISAVGSVFVTAAQKYLFGTVNIDKLAGPSDALILVDETANPKIVAANMLVETEHGPISGTVVLVPSKEFAEKVKIEVENLVQDAPETTKKIFDTALYDYSGILIYDNMDESIEFTNDYAAEHLQLTVKNPTDVIDKLKNVGAIQLGEYNVISSGDFFGGTADALPTGGMAKIFSDVSVYDFLKRIPVQYFSKEGFLNIADKAEKLAYYQRMYYHAKAINIRKNI